MRHTRRRTQAGLTPGKDDNEVRHNSCRNRLKIFMGVQYQFVPVSATPFTYSVKPLLMTLEASPLNSVT